MSCAKKTPAGSVPAFRLVFCRLLLRRWQVGGLAKYGLGYEDLKQIKPGLVYCSITGVLLDHRCAARSRRCAARSRMCAA